MRGKFKIDNEYITHFIDHSLKTPGLRQTRHKAR